MFNSESEITDIFLNRIFFVRIVALRQNSSLQVLHISSDQQRILKYNTVKLVRGTKFEFCF